MLSILAIFAWWYQDKVVTVHRENNDLLPVNFGRDFQLPDGVLRLHFAANHEQRPQYGRRGCTGIVQRVPVPRINRIHPHHRHGSSKPIGRSWNPGLPIHNQYIGHILQELHQLQQD